MRLHSLFPYFHVSPIAGWLFQLWSMDWVMHLATLGWQSCSSTGRRYGGVGGDLRLEERVGVVLSDSSAS